LILSLYRLLIFSLCPIRAVEYHDNFIIYIIDDVIYTILSDN